MPIINSLYFVPLASCLTSALLCSLLFFFLRRKGHLKHYITFTTLMALFIITCVLSSFPFWGLSNRLQIAIALPYIQRALDEQCGEQRFTAHAKGFYVDSGFHWSSDDNLASCYYNNVSWICSCETDPSG
jgi:hypothetical protein